VFPPAGYERKPVRSTDSFVLTPGQNLERHIDSQTLADRRIRAFWGIAIAQVLQHRNAASRIFKA
jgi:hypothetical protein